MCVCVLVRVRGVCGGARVCVCVGGWVGGVNRPRANSGEKSQLQVG